MPQVSWIQAQRGDAKKAGILAAVAKAPTLLKRLQAASNAAVVGTRGNAKAKEQDEVCVRVHDYRCLLLLVCRICYCCVSMRGFHVCV